LLLLRHMSSRLVLLQPGISTQIFIVIIVIVIVIAIIISSSSGNILLLLVVVLVVEEQSIIPPNRTEPNRNHISLYGCGSCSII
jgi:hypothetical protein